MQINLSSFAVEQYTRHIACFRSFKIQTQYNVAIPQAQPRKVQFLFILCFNCEFAAQEYILVRVTPHDNNHTVRQAHVTNSSSIRLSKSNLIVACHTFGLIGILKGSFWNFTISSAFLRNEHAIAGFDGSSDRFPLFWDSKYLYLNNTANRYVSEIWSPKAALFYLLLASRVMHVAGRKKTHRRCTFLHTWHEITPHTCVIKREHARMSYI